MWLASLCPSSLTAIPLLLSTYAAWLHVLHIAKVPLTFEKQQNKASACDSAGSCISVYNNIIDCWLRTHVFILIGSLYGCHQASRQATYTCSKSSALYACVHISYNMGWAYHQALGRGGGERQEINELAAENKEKWRTLWRRRANGSSNGHMLHRAVWAGGQRIKEECRYMAYRQHLISYHMPIYPWYRFAQINAVLVQEAACSCHSFFFALSSAYMTAISSAKAKY